ncbi:MAG: heme NO-binding domain-containing protein [Pseudomonadales bacterium]|nr:heme NO-binding domain-containing protein [Pseudomonadales bacterium]
MIGLIHSIFLGFLDTQCDQQTKEGILKKAGFDVDTEFRLDTVYSDEQWQRLFSIAVETLGVSVEAAEQGLAKKFYEDALERWSMWFEMSNSAREFLERQPKIHNGFASGLKEQDRDKKQSINDKFKLTPDGNKLSIDYKSPNHHCELYKALAQCLMDHYGDQAEITETCCMKKGDDHCHIELLWPQ